jgi:amino acid transporter
MIMAGPRVYYAMAQDRTFARTLARVNPRSGVPANALIAQAAWTSMLIVFFGAFEPLVVYVGFALTAFTIAAVLSVIVLRVKRPDLPRPFRVPLYPYLPLAFILASSWIGDSHLSGASAGIVSRNRDRSRRFADRARTTPDGPRARGLSQRARLAV